MDSINFVSALGLSVSVGLSTNIFALQATSGVRVCVDVWQV